MQFPYICQKVCQKRLGGVEIITTSAKKRLIGVAVFIHLLKSLPKTLRRGWNSIKNYQTLLIWVAVFIHIPKSLQKTLRRGCNSLKSNPNTLGMGCNSLKSLPKTHRMGCNYLKGLPNILNRGCSFHTSPKKFTKHVKEGLLFFKTFAKHI